MLSEMEREVRPDSQVLRYSGREGSTCADKEERGRGGGREGEIVGNSGGQEAFLRNWDRDPVGERRAGGIEEGRKKKRQMKNIRKTLTTHTEDGNQPNKNG